MVGLPVWEEAAVVRVAAIVGRSGRLDNSACSWNATLDARQSSLQLQLRSVFRHPLRPLGRRNTKPYAARRAILWGRAGVRYPSNGARPPPTPPARAKADPATRATPPASRPRSRNQGQGSARSKRSTCSTRARTPPPTPLFHSRARSTQLDKIKNLHSLDSIATETYGTHGRLTYRED